MAVLCGGFTFTADFDSGNLSKVELIPKPEDNGSNENGDFDFEFNVWPHADCAGTEFENGNRTWFHFGVKGGTSNKVVKLNIVNLNRQVKMFSQGMAPVYKNQSTCNQWERIREKPTFNYDGSVFTLSFKYRILDTKSFTYFAFTYPYSYSELQKYLLNLDSRFNQNNQQQNVDDIYYHRECVCYTLEGRRVDLLTISSHHDVSSTTEPRIPHLFPETSSSRPKKFIDKKVIFLSARVHPGETPSSFVMHGFLNFLLTRDDPIATLLRQTYVFKVIPMLNPDGVARGYYRTDTRGVNLNRYYTNPSHLYHPSVFAARSLILYHHYGCHEVPDSLLPEIETKISDLDLDRPGLEASVGASPPPSGNSPDDSAICTSEVSTSDSENTPVIPKPPEKSGLFLYMDFHGHASKKGIFMYGNHFQNTADKVECMLLAKIMSINSPHFHFHACNFTERIMYLRDRRDGLSREGAGRVAVGKITGLVRSYTLECNYNTGRIVNVVPAPGNEPPARRRNVTLVPPKYTPALFEEVGKALGVSILDMSNANPYSRIAHTEFHSLGGLRDWLRKVVKHESAAAAAAGLFKMRAAAKGRRRSEDLPPTKRKTKKEIGPKTEMPTKSEAERKENLIRVPKTLTKTGRTAKKLEKPPGAANVLQVRAKAVDNLACCSKSLVHVPTKAALKSTLAKKSSSKPAADGDNFVIKRGAKRFKISATKLV